MPALRSQNTTSHKVKQLTSQRTNSSLKHNQLPIRGKPPFLRAQAGRARELADGDRTGEERNEDEEARQDQLDSRSDAPLADERPDTQGKEKNKPKLHPQQRINQLWANFEPEHLGKITKILPDTVPSVDQTRKPKGSLNATNTYNEARSRCEDAVKRIVAECIASNTKYSDLFNIEADLKVNRRRDFLDGLLQDPNDRFEPSDVKRVSDIFDKPTFFSNGATFDDIIQGANGDCWLMSAFSILSCSKELVEKVCVIRDQDVGVYGFVFYRDGEWHPTIIDDKLYLGAEAFDEGVNDMLATWGKEQEQKYTELFQRGSRALYFAKCRDENETWVPLLEKAFAKAHAGYAEIQGGQTGEGVEDLTGGVTTEIYTTNILNKDKFWTDELRKMGKEFLFGASDALYREWRGYSENHPYFADLRKERRNSLIDGHAYAVLDTYDDFGERLVKVRNPWGRTEWSGAWADGSSQWTAEWLQRVGHKFGDDGVFWMSYSDFLRHFKHIDRTRLFDDSWYTSQTWASLQVPFSNLEYQQTKFTIDVPEDTETVIVLSQLDDRYWQGLEGRYGYRLQFRVSTVNNENEYIARSRPNYELRRSTNVELFLVKGRYTVFVKIEAQDWGRPNAEDVIRGNLPDRKEKVVTIGRLYDLAHQKGQPAAEEDRDDSDTQKVTRGEGNLSEPEKKDASESEPAVPLSIDVKAAPFPNPLPVVIVEAPKAQDPDSNGQEEDEKEPWNAACVVGLRVYSKQPELTVNVVWPPKPKPAEDVKPKTLDRDDITKAPQMEAERSAKQGPEESQEEPTNEVTEVKNDVEKEDDKVVGDTSEHKNGVPTTTTSI